MSAAVDILIGRLQAYYERHPTGGPLHLSVDDGNLNDSDLEFCRQSAIEAADDDAVAIAGDLMLLSIDDRDALFERYCEYSR